MHPEFGDSDAATTMIIDTLNLVSGICSSNTKLLLMDRYDTTFGICNHDLAIPQRPLLLIAQHSAEDSSAGSLHYERIDQFAINQVGKYFNISLKEFLEFPSDICTHLLESSARLQKTAGVNAASVLDELEK